MDKQTESKLRVSSLPFISLICYYYELKANSCVVCVIWAVCGEAFQVQHIVLRITFAVWILNVITSISKLLWFFQQEKLHSCVPIINFCLSHDSLKQRDKLTVSPENCRISFTRFVLFFVFCLRECNANHASYRDGDQATTWELFYTPVRFLFFCIPTDEAHLIGPHS